MLTQENTCGLDVWDLTLTDAQQVSSASGVSVFSTVYDGGFAGLLNAPASYAMWSVSGTGTGTTTVNTTNNSVNTVMDLIGISITDPSIGRAPDPGLQHDLFVRTRRATNASHGPASPARPTTTWVATWPTDHRTTTAPSLLRSYPSPPPACSSQPA